MAEYRIVAKVDPQTAAGTNKVKQDLRGIQTEAKATEGALNRSFDQAKFDRTIGALVNRLEQLDKTLTGLVGQNTNLARSNETVGQSLDRMAASSTKATNATKQGAQATDDSAGKNARLEAALMRVLRATDQAAAEQAQMNALLADAKRLLDAGMISAERYAQVQAQVSAAGREQVQVTGSQRIGMQQLGFQLGDVATMYSLGAKPAQIFGSQIGQISQALMLMGGSNGSMLSRVAGFLAGPWGVALTVGLILLAPLLDKLLLTNDALGESIQKLKEDARETELAGRAKEAFAKTVEGVTAAIREQNKELKESIQTQRDSLVQGMATARLNLVTVQTELNKARRELDDALAEQAIQRDPGVLASQGDAAGIALRESNRRVDEAKRAYESLRLSASEASEAIRRADAAMAQNVAQRAVDPIAKLNDEYDRLVQSTIEAAVASDNFSRPALARDLTLLERRRNAALEAAQAQDKLNSSNAKGVAIFQSREQAVGIAGRELQGAGLSVSENNQFGGVKGNHPGMGNAAHGKYAIDVNAGTGVVEADVPDLRAQFDGAARRYAGRGYKVLWNGKVYWPDGRITNIPGGQNQHRDHMHLEAPGTIVGKATNASTEAQFGREANEAAAEAERAARVEEQAKDFVSSVVAKAASRGLPNNRKAQLQSDIDEAFADFERRFNRAAGFTEKWAIATALTEADARETAQAFEDAYVKPLERLTALQGKTGLEREILNRKLEETESLGRALEPTEEKMIENGIRQSDQLERQSQILTDIRGPLEQYRATIEALNALFASGEISLANYNARMAGMAASAASVISDIPGVDPTTGQSYADIGAVADENARYAAQLEAMEAHRDQLLQLGIDYNALEEAAYQQHVQRLIAIDQARQSLAIQSAQSVAESLASIAGDLAGKQSRIYRTMFVVSKAFAIADSIVKIQQGIANALALPFPANIPAIASVAAQAASIISNIKAVSMNFADGGLVRGPGGPRSDSISANLSNGEYVVNARATSRNLPLLEAVNSGKQISPSAPAGRSAPTVIVKQYPGVAVETRQDENGDIEVVARRVAREVMQSDFGRTFADEMARPESRTRNAIHSNTDARPKR